MTPAAVLFDLYGTLVKVSSRPFSRRLPEALGVPRAAWSALLRNGLLTRAFPDDEAFARFVAESLAPERAAWATGVSLALLSAERDSVSLVPGALSLLAFLKRRGVKLGLVSNLASPFKSPVAALGLASAFDAVAYSCDEGVAKPGPEIYGRTLARLGVTAGDALFVGDNSLNDVRAPAALGLRTAGVGVAGTDATLATVAHLGLLDLSVSPFVPSLAVGEAVSVGHEGVVVERVVPLADDEHGRYNLVYRVDGRARGGAPVTLYAKRFLLPESVHVEVFVYGLQALTGLPACEAAILPGPEPFLAITEAPGRRLAGETQDPEIAYEAGRHFAFAFLFSNADVRPRNSFEDRSGGSTRLTVVDLEHCLFNLAIDTEGLERPERPETFDLMAKDEFASRLKKTVLTPRSTRRARRWFCGDAPKGSPVDKAFRAGFLDFYRRQQSHADALVDALLARVRAEPPLVIGTHGYRRAMAEVDVADIRARLERDPEAAYEATW